MSEENNVDEFLISLFVERRELFIGLLNEINRNINEIMKIDFKYDYDSFCREYLNLTKEFFQRHPEVDYRDLSMITFYTNIIIGELFLKIKMKYGDNDGRTDNGEDNL